MDKEISEISKEQYQNFRLHFQENLISILGEGYYNTGLDTYTCDMLTIKDIRREYDKLLYKNKILNIKLSIAIGMMLTCLIAAIFFFIV